MRTRPISAEIRHQIASEICDKKMRTQAVPSQEIFWVRPIVSQIGGKENAHTGGTGRGNLLCKRFLKFIFTPKKMRTGAVQAFFEVYFTPKKMRTRAVQAIFEVYFHAKKNAYWGGASVF